MAAEHAEEPVLAQEASPTTTLALADEPPTTTTVPLETKRVALEFWTARRDLHDSQTKAFKLLTRRRAPRPAVGDDGANARDGARRLL